MRKPLSLAILFVLTIQMSFSQQIDVQGHRGARGMFPENTIPAFEYALTQGVTTIELDVVITKDHKVVVSHEPYMNSSICLYPDGSEIGETEEKSLNIYQMTYANVKAYDCGSKGNIKFEEQQKQKVVKPLLSDVIKSVEWYIKSYSQYEVDYNIEIKSAQTGDEIYHPNPEVFSEIVYNLIDEYLPWNRIVIQSFDFRVLQYWHKNHPRVRLAALVENNKSITTNLANLGFKPTIYSPDYTTITKKDIKQLHDLNILVIPWTVNTPKQMQKLVDWKTDGIITDYPNHAVDLGLIKPRVN